MSAQETRRNPLRQLPSGPQAVSDHAELRLYDKAGELLGTARFDQLKLAEPIWADWEGVNVMLQAQRMQLREESESEPGLHEQYRQLSSMLDGYVREANDREGEYRAAVERARSTAVALEQELARVRELLDTYTSEQRGSSQAITAMGTLIVWLSGGQLT